MAPTGSPTLDCIGDAVNSAAAPFMNAPPPEQGAAGYVAQGLGGVLGLVGAPQQLIDNAFAGLTAPIAALFPAMPAITLLGMHVGMLHTHTHPPSLVPPAPPIPLPSIGMLVGSGSMAVLGCGMPLARAGDIGISVTCGSLAPPFEVFTGSSNVFVGGARAARILDITKHCDPTTMGPFGIAMGVAGVAAGAAGAIATGQAAAAAQAAADAAVLALKLLCGKDPGLPPGVGALLGPPLPTVMVGGFPCPPIGEMAVGALMKGLKRIVGAVKKLRAARRGNASCADGSHPIYLVTGENFDRFTDFVSAGLFRWERRYTTAHAAFDGPLGFGFRHCYQRHLDVRLHKATFIDWDGVELEFPQFPSRLSAAESPPGIDVLREHGYVLRRVAQSLTESRYELSTRGEPTMIFAGDRFTEVLPLVGMRTKERELSFEYDQNGWLVGAIDRARGSAEAQRYQLVHDERGRVVAIHELGKTPIARFACTYTKRGELHQVRDACNGLWTYEYDAAHRWTRQTDPRGYSYSFRYDEQGRCVWASGQDGLWAARVEYFPDKGFTRYVEGDEAVWEYHYDVHGFITKIVNPLGGKRIRERSSDGRILRDIDPGGRVLTFRYDGDGAAIAREDQFGYLHPAESVTPRLANPFERELPSSAIARTFAGTIARQPAAALGATGQLLEIPPELRQLAHGVFRLRRLRGPAFAPPTQSWRDPQGRLVYELDGLERARRWAYDAAGNEVARLDRDGRHYQSEITSWNLVGTTIDPLGRTVVLRYDSLEQVIALTDPAGNQTRWDYDTCQRMTKVWRHGRLRDSYEYDLGNHLVAKYDGDGNLLFRNAEFHPNHFVARRELASGGEHRYAYDVQGRIIEASTQSHEVKLEFDQRGARLRDLRDGVGVERAVRGATERVRVLARFEWTCERLVDRTLEITAPTGAVTRLFVGDDGVVLRECANGTRDWLQYDHDGRLEARLTARRSAEGTHAGWGVRYSYSQEGDLLAITDSARGTTQFEVDAAHRLIAEVTPRGDRHQYTFDSADNLLHTPVVSRLAIAEGNRIAETATEVFTHDARDRLSIRHHRDGAKTRYCYDSFDMLEAVELIDAKGQQRTWRATYDAIGRRLWTELDGRRREFFWDGDRLAGELAPDGQLRVFIYGGPDALVPIAFVDYDGQDASPDDGRLYQVFTDGVGMPLHIEDARREIVWWATRVDPWGRIEVHESATLEYNLRWPGHYFDVDTRLHYNRFRYYDPWLGRYLTPDPIGYRGSPINLYAYCPNPLVQVDVLGLTHGTKGDSNTTSTSGDNDAVDGPPTTKPRVAGAPEGGLSRQQGQAAIDAIHNTLRPADRKQQTTSLTEHADGSVSVTSSDTTNGVTPAQRKEAVSQLTAAGYDESAIHFPQNKPRDPMYVPKGDRNFPGASSGSHGEGRGAQAGAVHDNPAARQWSSSGASHGGAACDGCEGIQRSNGIKNETGFQSQGGRYDRGGTEPSWNGQPPQGGTT